MEEKHFRIELITEMLGTVPKDPDIYKTYIESKKPEEIKEEEFYRMLEDGEDPSDICKAFFGLEPDYLDGFI